jgi:hypothetical protein
MKSELDKLLEKYPNCYDLFENAYLMSSEPLDNNRLYEFFDENKLRGNVCCNTSGVWSFDIHVPKPLPKNSKEGDFLGWDRISFFTHTSYSREEAEIKLFEMMFEMLEEKIGM